MILDSLSQLRVLGRLGRTSRVGVRVNTGVGGGHHGHVITGGVDSKFGMEPSDVPESLRIAADHGLKITTVHQHIGSGIRDAELLLQAVDGLLLVAAQFPDLEVVDFGGGFGVPYRPGEAALDLERFGAGWRERVAALEARLQRPIHVACEPGRFVVAECGTLLVTVTARKRGSRHVFVGVDSGFHHLLRPALYGAHHEIENLSNPRGEPQLVRVAGNICESGDLLAVDRWLPECREGDILALRTVGAYGYSMASTYNLRPRPAEVLVQRDGTARRIRRRETLEDLLRSAGALA